MNARKKRRSGYVRITPWTVFGMMLAIGLCCSPVGAFIILGALAVWAITKNAKRR